jgi:glycosyltransferase involved in cell wall biosynthesis
VQWVTNPDTQILASLYKRASAIVLPSLCEGYGLPLIEAMYCDRPIVASRIPTSVEVAGCAAEFFSLGNKEEFWDAVIAAFTDVNAQQRKRCSSEQLKKYSWEYLAGNYAAVYEAARSRG